MSDQEAIDFHRWSARLALDEGYRLAWWVHDRWSILFEDGVKEAVDWAEVCQAGMMLEAQKGETL